MVKLNILKDKFQNTRRRAAAGHKGRGFSGGDGEAEHKISEDAAGGTQCAPAQRLTDFIAGRPSADLPSCSYLPGIAPVQLSKVLPQSVARRLKAGIQQFENKMRGYIHPDAVVVAPESRTSSPVRIPRSRETFQHTELAGLYPCGEGAGYAGGIVSAAIDGMRVADAVVDAVTDTVAEASA